MGKWVRGIMQAARGVRELPGVAGGLGTVKSGGLSAATDFEDRQSKSHHDRSIE